MTRLRHRLALYLFDRVGCLLCHRRQSFPVPARVALVRPEHFGDLVLTLPAIEHLRALFPKVQWCLLVRPEYREWAAAFRLGDEVHAIDPWWTRRPPERLFSRSNAAIFPKGLHCDLAVVFHGDLRTLLLARRYAPILAGDPSGGGGFLLSIARRRSPSQSVLHAHAQLVEEIGRVYRVQPAQVEADALPAPLSAPRLCWRPPGFRNGEKITPPFPFGELPPGPFLVFHPGAGQPSKLWPPDRWIELGRQCLENGFALVLTGSHAEAGLCQHLEAPLAGSHRLRLWNLAGRTSLTDLTTIVSRAQAVVAPDTGIIHLARALGVPTVALFGPIDPEQWGYQTRRHRSLFHQLPCSFCRLRQCPRRDLPGACMQAISTREVMRAIGEVLQEEPEPEAEFSVVLSDQVRLRTLHDDHERTAYRRVPPLESKLHGQNRTTHQD